MANDFPILLHLGVVLGFVIATMAVAHFLPKPHRRNAAKSTPYESGMDPVGGAHQPIDVKFYLVAILFLVFDVELLFLYPWAVAAFPDPNSGAPSLPDAERMAVFGVFLAFVGTLFLGYVYAARKGVFQWR